MVAVCLSDPSTVVSEQSAWLVSGFPTENSISFEERRPALAVLAVKIKTDSLIYDAPGKLLVLCIPAG